MALFCCRDPNGWMALLCCHAVHFFFTGSNASAEDWKMTEKYFIFSPVLFLLLLMLGSNISDSSPVNSPPAKEGLSQPSINNECVLPNSQGRSGKQLLWLIDYLMLVLISVSFNIELQVTFMCALGIKFSWTQVCQL